MKKRRRKRGRRLTFLLYASKWVPRHGPKSVGPKPSEVSLFTSTFRCLDLLFAYSICDLSFECDTCLTHVHTYHMDSISDCSTTRCIIVPYKAMH
jgi:hypothetical protein